MYLWLRMRGKLHTGIFDIGDEYDAPLERKAVADWEEK